MFTEKNIIFFCLSAILGTLLAIQFNIILLLITILFISFSFFRRKLPILLICIIIIASFFGRAYFQTTHFNKVKQTGTTEEFTIIFKDIPKISGNKLTGFAYDTKSKQNIWLQYQIKNKQEKEKLLHTTFTAPTFNIHGELSIPTKNTVENGFNFYQYLQNERVHYILTAETFVQTNINKPLSQLWALRERSKQFLERKLPEPLRYYTSALILGEAQNIPQEEYKSYQKIGVVHLFAISGAHVGLLVNALFYTLTRIGLKKQYAYIFLLIILPFYIIITGHSPSTVRAAGMYMLHSYGKLTNRNISSLQAICPLLLISLLIDPNKILSIGWQLTFTIAIGISLSQNILQRYPSYIGKLCALAIICQVISLPIILIHFYEISLAGFIFNIIYVPIFAYLLFPAVIFSYLSTLIPFFPGGGTLIFITNKLFIIFAWMSNTFAKIPFMSLILGKPNYLISILLIITILFFMVTWELNKTNIRLVASGILTICIIIIYHKNFLSNTGEVVFLDIGQGDACLITLPHNQGNYLIDTGGVFSFTKEKWQTKGDEFDTGKDIILPYLKSRGIRKLDKLILTHADQDHIGGSVAIINSNELKVKEIIIPEGQFNSFNKKINLATIAKKQKISSVTAGVNWKIKNNYFYILHPTEANVDITDLNDGSIVLYAVINEQKWLFTGDLEQDGEKEILQKFTNINVDILKVGHHGSKTSTSESFLQTIEPKIAVISCGRKNRYGHPHQEILQRLQDFHVKIMRTDQIGSISYIFQNKKKFHWQSYPP